MRFSQDGPPMTSSIIDSLPGSRSFPSNRPQPPWTDALGDIVEQFFGSTDQTEDLSEPDAPKSTADRARLREGRQPLLDGAGQVPLARLLGLFITLAPPPLTSAIVDTATGWPCAGPFRPIGATAWRSLGLSGTKHPDLAFASPDAVFIVRLKSALGPAMVDQIVSDALLVQQVRSALRPARCGVIYLAGPEQGEPGVSSDWSELRRMTIRRLPRVRRIASLNANARIVLADTIAAFELATLSFAELDLALGAYAATAASTVIESNLIAGLRRDLRLRGLADAPYLASDLALLARRR